MITNPEFKRNLWQELTRERLIAMPIILASIFWISYLQSGTSAIISVQSGSSAIISTAQFIMMLLLVVWGSGLAADAIFVEIRDHTWEAQRMTPLGPFKMTWGKLLGSTIFVWYGALICVIAILASNNYMGQIANPTFWFELFYYLFTGILVQALALFTAI
jgi:ABC-type Na+ efflux pump permease subunit